MSEWIDFTALRQIALLGLLCGAGLPAVFALGLRSLSAAGRDRAAPDSDRIVGGSPLGIAGAALCFAVVAAAIAWGIYLIVAGSSK